MSQGKQQSAPEAPADIDALALQAEANQDIAIERKANGKPEKPAHALASMLGPAFVAAVAYVDPGNVAANLTSGAKYGYLLVWVLVVANCMSVLIQYQAAKLGIVTGKSLPQILGQRMGTAGRFLFLMQAEVIAIATDLAEVIGGAIALNLLFGVPLLVGGCIIGAVSTVLLLFQGGETHKHITKVCKHLLSCGSWVRIPTESLEDKRLQINSLD